MKEIVLLLMSVTGALASQAGYLFTMPRQLWQGTKEKLCITRFEEGDRLEYNLDLVHTDSNSTTRYIFESGSSQCWNFDVPTSSGDYSATLSGSYGNGEVFNHKTEVTIQKSSHITLIQCDKPMYKPGQTVKFRIMTIDAMMKPKTGVISMVSIENPSGIRVRQWRDLDMSKGIASLEMALSQEPTMGKWTISVEVDGKNNKQTFIVKEYVLPKFEVTVTPPKYLLPDTPLIEGTVCAKYTYGKPVRGMMGLEICYVNEYYYYGGGRGDTDVRPCHKSLVEIDGCYEFSVNSSDLAMSSNRYSLWGRLSVKANITEIGTGITLFGESSGPEMTQTAYTIEITDETKGYFKPAFPYRAKVTAKKPDGSPAAGELIEITARNWEWDFFQHNNFTTDENGVIMFAVTDIPHNVTSISVQANSPRYQRTYDYYMTMNSHRLYQPQGYLSARRWYSPSNSYMHIERVSSTASCGQMLDVNVMYTTEANTTYKFYYMVMSSRHVVYHSHRHHHFLRHDAVERNPVLESMKLEDFTPPPRRPFYRPPRLIPVRVPAVLVNGTNTTSESEPTELPEPEIEGPLTEEPGPEPEPETEEVEEEEETEPMGHIASFTLHIPIVAEMAPNAKLLVYYIREDMETVADSITFNIEQCFNNKVDMRFEPKTAYPGSEATIRVKAEAGSFCSIGVVDKSINLLGGNHQLTPEKIYSMIENPYFYYGYWGDDQEYCEKNFPQPEPENTEDMPRYYYGYYAYDTNTVDAVQAFRDLDMVVFTDLTLETRPCSRRRRIPVAIHRNFAVGSVLEGAPDVDDEIAYDSETPVAAGAKADKKTTKTRSFFPETFLWDLELIGDDGEVVLTRTLPHTITEWVGNTICANTEVGIGTSPLATITAFQPFFLSFTLPYSAVRGETVPVTVTIFNYLKECLVMLVRLEPSDGFELMSADRVVQRCVCGGDSDSIKYYIKPTQLGEIEILAAAESIQDDGTCGNNAVSDETTGVSDAVKRMLLIEAEGVEKEYTFSSYMCAEGESKFTTIDLLLPPTGVVEDSARGKVSVIGDIMGPALSNLQGLLRMPYGCGEQNMASWSPNIVVLQYLTNTNQLTSKIETEALNYMRIGYQRQLNYRHDDGSYSAFGNSNADGSMWLTAFVVKCFGQSQPFIDIDNDDLVKSLNWFRRRQLENGCFPKIGYTHSYYLKGGISKDSNEAAMTAFVIIAMLEAGVSKMDTAVTSAVRCLDVQDNNDTYTLSLMAYAYTLYDVNWPQRSEVMAELEERAMFRDDGILKYWTRNDEEEATPEPYSWQWYRAPSAEIEITSYILLSTIIGEQDNAVINAQPIVMWLTKQRNTLGGFSSTQDTVIGLQALSVYATLVYRGGMHLDITFRGIRNEERVFSITGDNNLVLQSSPLEVVPDTLETEVYGVGCALIQAHMKYNIDEPPTGPAFNIRVSAFRSKEVGNDCKRRTLNICASFTGPGGVSNMAMVDVKMVTGWVPVTSTLDELVNDQSLGIQRYEVDGNLVHIYFDKFDSAGQCFYFDVEQDIEVTDPKKAFIKVFDYYETDLQVVIQYNLRTTCGTKQELPEISVDQYLRGVFFASVDEIVQVRIPPGLEGEPAGPVMTCPACIDATMNRKSADFKNLVCGSETIYKVSAGRSGTFPMKIYADLRSMRKTKISTFVKYDLGNNCVCGSIPTTEDKVLIFGNDRTFEKKMKKLHLNDQVTLMPWTREVEKSLGRLVTRPRRGCN
ncbi:alpha-2-macroglobulin-like isoform X2 [Mizuhopecten yessoensis]|uniref:alpha-2-macroglobulin-like isoform X2 n=1 Tax=Mizuhopecten yessoensis TaxID=6573 RepID=UPI000B45BF7C|nr:alpha-2-macroglobulin-like isoform X2 [Mizuhopecten yessoensis]